MRVLFINNDGGGFANRIEIVDGMTVGQLFADRLPHGRPEDYLIRVNRQPTSGDAVLQPEDRISITPTKIEGATRFTAQERSFRGRELKFDDPKPTFHVLLAAQLAFSSRCAQ